MLLGNFEQYKLRRERRLVSSVIANPKSWFTNMWSIRCCKSGIELSSPTRRRFAISRKNTPDLHDGSRKVVFLSCQRSFGSMFSIWLTISGGVRCQVSLSNLNIKCQFFLAVHQFQLYKCIWLIHLFSSFVDADLERCFWDHFQGTGSIIWFVISPILSPAVYEFFLYH